MIATGTPVVERMRALTILQPWAYCIAVGAKPVENRSRSTAYRGPLAIHAGRRWAEWGADDPRVLQALRPFLTQHQFHRGYVDHAELPGRFVFGAVLAVAHLTDCHRAVGCCEPWGDPDDVDRATWHWVLKDVRLLLEPMPARGCLGLWNVDLPRAVIPVRADR
jgi:hypothetical protein